MSNNDNRTLLEQTFALTSQREEGTVARLDVTVEMRKIPASLRRLGPHGPVTITTTRRFAQTRLHHGGVIPDIEDSEDEASTSNANEESRIEEIRQEIIDVASSDEDNEEEEDLESDGAPSEASEETERNFQVPPPPYSQERSPPPYPQEAPSSRRQGRPTTLRSPSPPGYVPSTSFHSLYSPPIRLRSEEEYQRHRRELIAIYNRDRMDLYYKYEFHAQQLKRARRQYQ